MAYVNRENLIQVLAHENSNTEIGRQYYGAIYQKVMNFPTADVVEVKHGEWVDNGIQDSMLSECSLCGFPCGAYTFNYCPNCGAKMDGRRDT